MTFNQLVRQNPIRAVRETSAAPAAPPGDIVGALGTIRHDQAQPRSLRRRLLTLLAILGPGLIVMVGDNDVGGVSTYTQAGQDYGVGLLWTLVVLVPVLIVNQEMAARLGAVTGAGHARLILARFGRFWGAFSVGDLFVLNFLTLVTEFVGIDQASTYFGVSPWLAVPASALGLVAMTVSGSFRSWERFMYAFVAFNFFAIPLAVISHPDPGQVAHGFLPQLPGGPTSSLLLVIVGIVGTTVAPWQLYFQQSNVIDKRITPRWLAYERLDTVLGSIVVVLGAAALIVASAFALGGSAQAGHFRDAGTTAALLAAHLGPLGGALFAIVLLNAAMIGAAAVTLATSYAIGDVFGSGHSLNASWRQAKGFYAIFAGLVALAAGVVLLPHAPLGLITLGVQALAGTLLPCAAVFLLMLANDRELLGPWVNSRWLNVLASLIVGLLIMLSAILCAVTILPGVDVRELLIVLGTLLLLGLAAVGATQLHRGRRPAAEIPEKEEIDRLTWQSPPLAQLRRPAWSRSRKVALLAMQAYLLLAVALVVAKLGQLALAGG